MQRCGHSAQACAPSRAPSVVGDSESPPRPSQWAPTGIIMPRPAPGLQQVPPAKPTCPSLRKLPLGDSPAGASAMVRALADSRPGPVGPSPGGRDRRSDESESRWLGRPGDFAGEPRADRRGRDRDVAILKVGRPGPGHESAMAGPFEGGLATAAATLRPLARWEDTKVPATDSEWSTSLLKLEGTRTGLWTCPVTAG
jgi:hypothetical protein